MLDPTYTLASDDSFMFFEFDSIGPKGNIKKIVQYTRIGDTNYYNLGFGDKHPDTNEIDDMVITNNGDSRKVLATVAQTIFTFTDKHPFAYIVATGSTVARTRLYRIGISNNLSIIENDFEIFGLLNDNWHPFHSGTETSVFLVKRKSFRFEL